MASLTPPTNPDWAEIDPYAPVWVVGVPKTIVNGHNGFLFATPDPDFQKPYLLEWLVGIHINGPRPGSPVMTTPNSCPPPDIPDGSA